MFIFCITKVSLPTWVDINADTQTGKQMVLDKPILETGCVGMHL